MEGRGAALTATACLLGRGVQAIRQLNGRLDRMLARVRILEVDLERHDDLLYQLKDRLDRLERLESRMSQSIR